VFAPRRCKAKENRQKIIEKGAINKETIIQLVCHAPSISCKPEPKFGDNNTGIEAVLSTAPTTRRIRKGERHEWTYTSVSIRESPDRFIDGGVSIL
jgi:hypothetical protein